jgi:CubicO group peptidase (beta-lactamase class C family)
VPGISAVVVQDGEVIFSGGSGLADIESATPITADSVLYIGSVSKVLTAVLTLQLVEAEQLSLQDPVTGIATDVSADSSPVTVANLLTHSSGLSREGDFGYWYSADFPDKKELENYLSTSSLRSAPGLSSHYSNIGYAALGLLIEKTTGKSYGEALRDRLLTPLEMSASGAPGPAKDIAKGYTPANRIIPSPERAFAGVGKAVGERHERTYHDAQAMSPAFGAYASANDMGRLANFLLGYGHDGVLSPAMRALMHQDQLSGRGFGLKVQRLADRTVARHDGWFAAHRTHLLLDIDNGTGVVVLANSDNASPGKIAEALLEAALAAVNRSGKRP